MVWFTIRLPKPTIEGTRVPTSTEATQGAVWAVRLGREHTNIIPSRMEYSSSAGIFIVLSFSMVAMRAIL